MRACSINLLHQNSIAHYCFHHHTSHLCRCSRKKCNLVADVGQFQVETCSSRSMNDNTLYSIYFANLVLFPPSSLATGRISACPSSKQQAKGGEDNDVDEEDAGVNSTWIVPSRSSFTPCRAKKGPCSGWLLSLYTARGSKPRGQGELRCPMRVRIAILCRIAPLFFCLLKSALNDV